MTATPHANRAWTAADVPEQSGRVVIITGANSGLGLASARVLAARHAHVVLACRNESRGHAALAGLLVSQPGVSAECAALDLASLASIRHFAEAVLRKHDRVDVLMNNAGMMATPFVRTEDGFELQLGVNHLGHFALTLLLLPRLMQTPGARVVNVSSAMHRTGHIDLDDLFFERRPYEAWGAYGQSKLANLLFTLELDRRLRAAGAQACAVAAHPGYAATALQEKGPDMRGSRVLATIMRIANALAAQSADQGAWPQLRAATDPDVQGGEYFGPTGLFGWRGPAGPASRSALAQDARMAGRLWAVSEILTGVVSPI